MRMPIISTFLLALASVSANAATSITRFSPARPPVVSLSLSQSFPATRARSPLSLLCSLSTAPCSRP